VPRPDHLIQRADAINESAAHFSAGGHSAVKEAKLQTIALRTAG